MTKTMKEAYKMAIRTLSFDLVEYNKAYNLFIAANPDYTDMQLREFKKGYFKGSAFNTAFPLAGFPLPQRWQLEGTAIVGNEELEFTWKPDGWVSFDELMQGSSQTWAKLMYEMAGDQEPISIKCEAWVS